MFRAYKKIFNYFDKLEDRIRAHLSRHPIIYSFIGGFAIVLFWKGVWDLADAFFEFILTGIWSDSVANYTTSGLVSVAVSSCILMLTGLFASFFVGDVIIISGIKKEKKLIEKSEDEIAVEASSLLKINETLAKIEGELKDIKENQ